jgi:peptide subunit release factor 1 (eRF1)
MGVFEPLTFALPLPTALAVGPTPALAPLARFVDDHPAYAVLMADQREAVLSDIRRATRGQSLQVESSLYPRKQKAGGLSQRRYQSRADERVAAFARVVADETQRRMEEFGVEQLIVAGAEVMTSALDAAFSPWAKERIVAVIRLEMTASEQEMIEATLPLVEEAERAREMETVRAIADAVGAAERGAAGAAGVLSALQNGQVATLAMNDDFGGEGWADYGRETYGVGPVPETHPLGGDIADLISVDLFEEFTRLALRGGAEIEIIHSAVPVADDDGEALPRAGAPTPRTEAASQLDGLGGVGALLRFDVEPA